MLQLDGIETAYTATFLNIVAKYASSHRHDLAEFIQWFDEQKDRLSRDNYSHKKGVPTGKATLIFYICQTVQPWHGSLLQVEIDRQVKLRTDGFAALFAGFPLRHQLDDANSFVAASTTNVTQNLHLTHTTVFLNNKRDKHTTPTTLNPGAM